MSIFSKKVRVRFAPSPTGSMHIGNFRTALYNHLFAKKRKGQFILRIEDTDQARKVEGGVENIISVLKFFGIEIDEGPNDSKLKLGPYIQSERLDIYKKHAEQLIEQGSAYYCDCSSERLTEVREDQTKKKLPPRYDRYCRDKNLKTGKVIRLKVPEQGTTVFSDEIRGKVEFENSFIDDCVLIKSDGFPTYHLANVVDDHLMKITHVIRGEEWISSTPKHILLYEAFNWKVPVFAHLPLLLNADKSKLSKRQGDVAIEDYVKKGYLKDALINFIALLGWNPKEDQEIYDIKTLIKHFDLKKVNKSGAVVNFKKLDWMNGYYIRQLDLDELTKLCAPYLPSEGDYEFIKSVVALEQERLKKISDIVELTRFFFQNELKYDINTLVWKKMKKESVVPNLIVVSDMLLGYSKTWESKDIEEAIKEWIEKNQYKTGEILWPMRVALSGQATSPGPFDIAEVLGKEKTLNRIKHAIKLAEKL